MELSNPDADVLVPDGGSAEEALSRTTLLAVGAHQDDIEFMALHGILECFGRRDRSFTGVTVTDGAGSPRSGPYADYTDAEMRAANAAFLENVIPRLESRSYVPGYAFYQWTGDTTLVEGAPLTPTNVGREYVGAIESGQAYNFAGVDMGEHVAYLAGGLGLTARLLRAPAIASRGQA